MTQQINDLRAKYSANGNAVIPNTFQHPNIFIDKLMYYLSPSENVVLTFAVRRILGFQSNIMSRKDNISLSQFTDGITAEDGHALSMGCGLGMDAVIHGLETLEKYKILIACTEKPDPRKGQEYWLQDNENIIDWEGLEKRKDERKAFSYTRTQKARYSVGQNTSVGQKARGDVGQNPTPLSDRDTKPTETHGNKEAATPRPLSSSEMQEVKTEANKTVDGYLENEKVIQEKDNAGQAWRGRELCPPNYLIYGDWWHAKTKQHMYGAKGKQRSNTEWLRAFKEFYEHDIPLSVLDETYEAEIAWKKIISKPSELVTKAIAIAALPPISEAKPMDTESYNQHVFNKIKQSLGVTA
jgi:hypothetical protein